MIKVNGIEVKANTFPDHSMMLLDTPVGNTDCIKFEWYYNNDTELVELIYLVNHYRSLYGLSTKMILFMPYIPNARMDRVKENKEVFTLKYFSNLINSLNFESVYVLDPHSNVSSALIDRVKVLDVSNYISRTIDYIREDDDRNCDFVIYFPDDGAYKRYKDIHCLDGMTKIYGQKVRDWKTGEILGLEIVDEERKKLEENSLEGKKILMIDDIISYGGTFYYSVLELKKYNPTLIYAYATHVETESLWDSPKGKFGKLILNRTVERLFTTNSIYTDKDGECYNTTFKIDNTII